MHNSGPCDGNPGLRTVIEEKEATRVYDKLDPQQQRNVDKAIDLIREGKAGGNQDSFGKDLKNYKAVDVKGTGRNRGGVRVVYKESINEVLIHSIQDYH